MASPWKLFIVIIYKNIFWIKVSNTVFHLISKQKHWWSGLPLPYDCGNAAVRWCTVRRRNSQGVLWIISASELSRELVQSHKVSATYNSIYHKKHIYILFCAWQFQERTVKRVAVCLSVTAHTLWVTIRTSNSCDMQRDCEHGEEFIHQKGYNNMHITLCSSVTAHRLLGCDNGTSWQ